MTLQLSNFSNTYYTMLPWKILAESSETTAGLTIYVSCFILDLKAFDLEQTVNYSSHSDTIVKNVHTE